MTELDYVARRPYREGQKSPKLEEVPDLELDVALICPQGNCATYVNHLRALFRSLRTIRPSLDGRWSVDENGNEIPPPTGQSPP